MKQITEMEEKRARRLGSDLGAVRDELYEAMKELSTNMVAAHKALSKVLIALEKHEKLMQSSRERFTIAIDP